MLVVMHEFWNLGVGDGMSGGKEVIGFGAWDDGGDSARADGTWKR